MSPTIMGGWATNNEMAVCTPYVTYLFSVAHMGPSIFIIKTTVFYIVSCAMGNGLLVMTCESSHKLR